MSLNATEAALCRLIAAGEAANIELLVSLVEQNSASDNLPGIISIADRLAERYGGLGSVERHSIDVPRDPVDAGLGLPGTRTAERGHHLVIRVAGRGSRETVMLLGHMDTVYSPASPFQSVTRDTESACGPGIVDMKGGLVVMLAAVGALKQSDAARPNLLIVLNSDEEVSSNTSRELIQRLVRDEQPTVCLCVEPGTRRADGAEELVVERLGHACLQVGIYGTACHASKPELGVSAVCDLARKIQLVERLAEAHPGTLLNVGVVKTAPDATYNTVARYAQMEIDIRFDSVEHGRELLDQLKHQLLKPYSSPVSGLETEIRLEELFFAPPMPPHPGQGQIVEKLQRIALDIDYPARLVPVKRPGRSDANIVANLGVPSVDGLGIVGVGSHVAFGEVANLSSVVLKAQLMALLLHRMAG